MKSQSSLTKTVIFPKTLLLFLIWDYIRSDIWPVLKVFILKFFIFMFKMSFKRHFKQIIASEEINKSKRAGLWESQPMIRVGKLTIWVRSFEIIIEFTKSISPTRIRKPVLMMDVKAFIKKTQQNLIWSLIYVRIKNCA